jgi:hypothetical protein
MTKLLKSFTAPLFAAALLSSCSGGDKGVTTPGGPIAFLSSITISGSNSTNVGGTLQLTASPKDQNGAAINAAVVWTTSSAFVATVNSSGLVTGVAAGQATISATSGTIASSTLVTDERRYRPGRIGELRLSGARAQCAVQHEWIAAGHSDYVKRDDFADVCYEGDV